jgi:hypothetical protein
MTLIEMHQMTAAFRACWVAAGRHLDRQVDGGIIGPVIDATTGATPPSAAS